jgi:cytochrome c
VTVALRRAAAPILFGAAVLAACRSEPPVTVLGGDPERGAAVIGSVGCGSCHTIPGIRAADGVVGPPREGVGRRRYIAGELPNRPDTMVRWLLDPQAIEPDTGMPDLGLTEAEARDVAAYLFTLR